MSSGVNSSEKNNISNRIGSAKVGRGVCVWGGVGTEWERVRVVGGEASKVTAGQIVQGLAIIIRNPLEV